MKVAIFALLIVGIYFGYQFTIGSVFREYQTCYDNASLEIASRQVPDTQKCVTQKLEYDGMKECIVEIQKSSNLVSFLYQASPAKKNVEADLELHNDACPSHKVRAPKQSFYISTETSR